MIVDVCVLNTGTNLCVCVCVCETQFQYTLCHFMFPQRTILPVSLDAHGFLSAATPCQLTLSGALRLDHRRDASLELAGQTCRPLRLSGALTHSFPGLRSRGLPPRTTLEASGPGAHGDTAALLVRSASCHIGVTALPGTRGRARWLWAMESKCPFLQVHFIG